MERSKEKNHDKHHALAIISIVAIVAVVGIVFMFMGKGNSVNIPTQSSFDEGIVEVGDGEDLAGQAISVYTSTLNYSLSTGGNGYGRFDYRIPSSDYNSGKYKIFLYNLEGTLQTTPYLTLSKIYGTSYLTKYQWSKAVILKLDSAGQIIPNPIKNPSIKYSQVSEYTYNTYPGTLKIISAPDAVFSIHPIDEEFASMWGETFRDIITLNPGKYILNLNRSGHIEITSEFSINPGETKQLSFILQPLPSSGCTDSDGGIYPFEYGTVADSTRNDVDECMDQTKLAERYCLNGQLTGVYVYCNAMFNKVCSNGACI